MFQLVTVFKINFLEIFTGIFLGNSKVGNSYDDTPGNIFSDVDLLRYSVNLLVINISYR